jgi:hypothetical protein
MASLKYLNSVCRICVMAALSLPLAAQSNHQVSVGKVSVVSTSPFQLQIRTSAAVTPQTQLIAGRERLVIDIPGAVPGAELRGFVINRAEVQGVRVSLFSAQPPVTRIVVDLNQPQWYRVASNADGLLVSLGTDSETAGAGGSGGGSAPTVGWVSAKSSATSFKSNRDPFVVVGKKNSGRGLPAKPSGPSVLFANGLLTIHGGGGSLSDILFQIQKQTGAEIAIPSGTEQDRVGADFGPGPASEVLGQLLNGAGLNFVVVGSAADPKILRSVLLTRKSGGADAPAAAQVYTPAASAENIVPESTEANVPQPEENGVQPATPAAGGPPPDPPPG